MKTTRRWCRFTVKDDTKHNYIFGDNLLKTGTAGQACIRGLANAFGVPTKKRPSMTVGSFFSDKEFEDNAIVIMDAILAIPRDKPIVWSKEIGCGLAQMKQRAPQTHRFLLNQLEWLEDHIEHPEGTK